jgi:hypothetical protein
VVQYDIDGNLIKIWDSGKEIAQKYFNDYKIPRKKGSSKIYTVLSNTYLKYKFKKNSYWLKYEDLIKEYNLIPKKINIDEIIENDKKLFSDKLKSIHKQNTKTSRYTVIEYNKNNVIIAIYNNYNEAAYELKLSIAVIKRICRGEIKKNENHPILKYGKKKLQPIKLEYPKYDIKPTIKQLKPKIKTRTFYTVIQYDENSNIINKFLNSNEASIKLNLDWQKIRKLCRNKNYFKNSDNKITYLTYGEKITIRL